MAGGPDEDAAAILTDALAAGRMSGVDHLRISTAFRQAGVDPELLGELAGEARQLGAGAAVHVSNQRELPTSIRTHHNLTERQVRLGTVAVHDRTARAYHDQPFGVSMDSLRTSMVVIGPPGSGKTQGFAIPILEHLELQALANCASIVVVDPKGDDFAFPGWFDYTIDPLDPTCGFSLYGGSDRPDAVADRLASALLPVDVSPDKAYFSDSAKNALYWVLAPFQAAHDRWPTVKELLELLEMKPAAVQRVKVALGQKDKALHAEMAPLLERRQDQLNRRDDPSSGLVQRLALLDRPTLTRLFDELDPKFEMRMINRPVRVRFVLPESEMPEASQILARLVTSQFVQVVADPGTNRGIFKGFVCDESGPFVDRYVERAVQKIRSNNAGMVLLAQSLEDFDIGVRQKLLGSVGCWALFGGASPDTAEEFSKMWGSEYRDEVTRTTSHAVTSGTTVSSGTSNTYSVDLGWFSERTGRGDSEGRSESQGVGQTTGQSVRSVEVPIWSAGELVNVIPARHCMLSLASSSGERTPPLLVRLGS